MEKAYIVRDPGDPSGKRVRINFVQTKLHGGKFGKSPCVPGRDYSFLKTFCFYFENEVEARGWCQRVGYQAEVVL